MKISHDKKYINGTEQILINNGYGEIGIHSIHFDRHFTEEQKQENSRLSNIYTREQWSKHCEDFSKSLEKPMMEILEQFISKYNIHQVSEETSTTEHYRSDWDLYFESSKGWNEEKYMDSFKLNFNSKRNAKQHMNLLAEIIDIVEKMDYENIYCRIQYDALINKNEIKEKALKICEKLVDKFINYQGMEGKIKVVGSYDGIKEYGFFKKNSRKRYYTISNEYLLVTKQLQ
jgi:hypothetical protein